MKLLKVRKYKGFNLIELIIVLVLMGIVGKYMAQNVGGGSSDGARAKTLYSSAQKIQSSWSLIVANLGISSSMTSNVLLANATNTPLDVIMAGDNPAGLVSATYTQKFASIGLRPLSDLSEVATAPAVGTAGVYNVNGYPLTASTAAVGNQNVVNVQYASVPTNVVQTLYLNQTGAASFTAGTAVSTGKIQYTAVSGGTHTLTIQLPM